MRNSLLIPISLLFFNAYSQQIHNRTENKVIPVIEQRELNLKPESTEVYIPLEVDLTQYKNIVISVEGWHDFIHEKEIRDALKQSIFAVNRKSFKKNKTKMEKDTLYFFWNQSNDWDDRTTSITIRDSTFKVIYNVVHTNVGSAKILNFLLSI